MIIFKPILCIWFSSSFACASSFASSDGLITQKELETPSIAVIEQNSFLQETKSCHDPAVADCKPVGLQFLSENEMKIINLLNEYLDSSNSNQRVAMKKSDNDLKKAFKKSHKAKSSLKKTKKGIKKAEKGFREAAKDNSSMNEMLSTFYNLKVKNIQKAEIDFKQDGENEEIIAETQEQIFKQFVITLIDSVLENFESEKTNENVEKESHPAPLLYS